MPDVFNRKKRSEVMSRIRGKDTRPELVVRRELFRLGYRFRLHRRDLPGCPDIVLPRHRAVVLVHGCFWHGHGCSLFKWPASNVEFWRTKIERNVEVDRRSIRDLLALGWRVLVVWECALKGRNRLPPEQLVAAMDDWLKSVDTQREIRERSPR